MRGGRVLGGWLGGAASAVAIACLLATGCGTDGTDATDEPPASAPNGSLTARQYAQLERLHRAQLPLSRGEPNQASMRRTVRSCRKVDASDELLAAVVDGCERLMGAFAGLLKRDCSTQEQCIALLSDAAALIDDLLETIDANVPVIERHVSDQACRDVLLSKDQAAALAELSEAFRDFVAIAQGGDPGQLATAQAELKQATDSLDEAPSSREMLRRFQSACQPVAG